MTNSSMTPSQIVADKLMVRFVDKKLLTEDLTAEIQAKVAAGTMQPADWKLAFEKALDLHKSS